MSPQAAIADLSERFWSFYKREVPLAAILAGSDPGDDQLMREGPDDYARRAVFAAGMLAEIEQVTTQGLSLQDRVTRDLLARQLRVMARGVAVRAHLRPTLYPINPEFTLAYFNGSTSLETVEDARRYVARMATVPQALGGVSEALEAGVAAGIRYPRLVVEKVVEAVRGVASGPLEESAWYGPFQRAGSRGEAFAAEAARALELIETVVRPAYHAHADVLETALGPVARDSISCVDDVDGEAFYRHMIEFYTTTDADPDEVHQLGLTEVARVALEMEAAAAEAGFPGDPEGFRRQMQSDPSQIAEDAEQLREQMETLSKRIDAKIPEFFGRIPRITYGIRTIPEAIADKMPPAYAQANPTDNSSAGIHWVTPIPQRCPRYLHLPLALHEAWPGHLMHKALIQEMDGLPAFRRFASDGYSACFEGWALYCERLGEEMGFYDTPQKRFARLEMEQWRAMRLVLDTGIHWKGWTRDDAIAFAKSHAPLPEATMISEIDRFIGFPGQALAYQLGNITFREARKRAEARLGDSFRVRDFHDALMAMGLVTLPVLDELMDEWTETRATAAAA